MRLLLLTFGAAALHAQSTCGTVGLSLTSDYQYAIGTSNGGTAFALTENGQTLAQGPITQLDLFHFDNSLQSSSGISPAKTVGTSFVPGKFGTALAIAPVGVVSYPSAGNVSVIDGTIEMWVAAGSNASALVHYSTLFQYKAANGDQILLSAAAAGFYAKIIVGQTTTGAGGSLTAWPAGAWHHVALTYSSTLNRVRIYVDGQMTDQAQGPFPMPAADGQPFTIDSDTGDSPTPSSTTRGSQFLIDEVRISKDEKTPAQIQYDFSRSTPFANNEVFLPLTGLSSGTLTYSVTQSGSTAACGSASAAFLGIPITNPTPASTLLPPGATSVSLSVQTPAATSCGYSVNTQVSYSAMTPFDKGQGSTAHSATIQGLTPDPSQVNDVYVRCGMVPDYVVHLQYRAVSAVNQPFPRVSYIFAQPYSLVNPNLARYALWAFDNMPPGTLTQLRQVNPGVPILFQAGVVDEDLTYLPESHYLHDVNGNRIEGWPGQYYSNMTDPAVQAYKANLCYENILSNNLLYDGCYFDTFFYPGFSNQQTDYLGNVHLVDAFGTGQQTDQQSLNTAWRAGMLGMMADLRQLMPNAYMLGHLSPPDSALASAFNGDSLVFLATDVLEGRLSFDYVFQQYNSWWSLRDGNAMTIIESSPQAQIAYGYGFSGDLSVLPKNIPPGVLTFAQDFYPYMRFPLALTLMSDGYFDRNLGDLSRGYTNWWYDEYDFNLGFPVAPAAKAIPPVSSSNLLQNPGFEGGLANWRSVVQSNGQAKATATVDSSIGADGNSSAHIDIQSAGTIIWDIDLEQDNLSLIAGKIYQVQFWARADTPRTISVVMQGGGPNYLDYGLDTQISIGTSWKLYSASFSSPTTGSDARLEFSMGDVAGNVWLDDVQLSPGSPGVYRRDYTNGVVLLNGTKIQQTIPLEAGLQRFKGTQAPLYQYIVDDATASFSATGSWTAVAVNSGTCTDDSPTTGCGRPPFYHCWQNACHELATGNGTAQWNLNIPADGQYTLQTWLPAAPNASSFATNAIYEIVSNSGNVIATVPIDQTTASAADGWHIIATVNLTAADAPFVRLHNGGSGLLVADAIYVTSSALYNDGSPAPQVTLAPLDGILLQRQQPVAAPSSRVNSVVNAASFQPSIASGVFVSITGTGFGNSTRGWTGSDFSGGNLPPSLDGISVTINGKPAYVEYISPTQINAIAPDDDTIGQVPVQVTTPQGASYAGTVLKQKMSPALFTYPSGTATYAAAVHLDGTLVGPAGPSSRPAVPGEEIEIFGTGFGATTPAISTGPLVSQPAQTALPVTMTIGSVAAEVQWAGLVSSGLYQLNVKIPNLAAGDQQVQATIGGFQSPATVMLSIASQ